MQNYFLTHSPPKKLSISPVPTAEAVVAVLLDMGIMVFSVGSMVASEAVMAMLPFITMSVELLHFVVGGFLHRDGLRRLDG